MSLLSESTIVQSIRFVIESGAVHLDEAKWASTYWPRESVLLRQSDFRRLRKLAEDEIAASIAEQDAENAALAALRMREEDGADG